MNSHSQRWRQFGLRTLLVFVTLAAIGTCAGHRWWSTRPVHLVEKFNDLFASERYAEAEEVADTMSRLHPGEVADAMVGHCRCVRELHDGEYFVFSDE